MKRILSGLALVMVIVIQGQAIAQQGSISMKEQQLLESITPTSLEGHLEFLASDELMGRNTPSPGLDMAALYIATQFKRAGLEPAGNDGYFQTSEWVLNTVERERTLSSGETRIMRSQRPTLVENAENPEGDPFLLRNVVGLIPGSDPVLKDTYILVTAHYDHVGVRSGSDTDSIANGANDNGSGTVGVIELGAALARLEIAPKRSILFIAWFGEEKGMLGSAYYAEHPVVPLEKTIGVVNLEMIGRTDDGNDGDQSNRASFTGFDFTDLPQIFVEVGDQIGIEVFRHPQNSERYFGASDNGPLARKGVPAHTICVTFTYDDYHQVGDHWEKIDFVNMARTTRLLAVGLLRMADSDRIPVWNEENPGVERYFQAWKELHGKG
ncbi:M28 family peptidase [Candidatus Zixiibacteriota bacterium]